MLATSSLHHTGHSHGLVQLMTMAVIWGSWQDGRDCRMAQWSLVGKGKGRYEPWNIALTPYERGRLAAFGDECCVGGGRRGVLGVWARTALLAGMECPGWEAGYIDEPPSEAWEERWDSAWVCEWFTRVSHITGVSYGGQWNEVVEPHLRECTEGGMDNFLLNYLRYCGTQFQGRLASPTIKQGIFQLGINYRRCQDKVHHGTTLSA